MDRIQITLPYGLHDVSTGLVALEVEDALTLETSIKVMPFAGVQGVTLPIYLSAQVVTETRAYGDGKVKPVAYNYTAVATATIPAEGQTREQTTEAYPTKPTTQEQAKKQTQQPTTATNPTTALAETLTAEPTPTPYLVIDRDRAYNQTSCEALEHRSAGRLRVSSRQQQTKTICRNRYII